MTALPITAPGVYDLPDHAYHSDCCDGPSISASGLKRVLTDPAEYWRLSYLNPDRDAEADRRPLELGRAAEADRRPLELGRAAHLLLLEPERVARMIAVIPHDILDRRGAVSTDEAKSWVAYEKSQGRIPLKPVDWAMIEAMRDQLAARPVIRRALRRGRVEVSLIMRDAPTGIWLKSRPDFLPEESSRFIADYKTTGQTDIAMWERAALGDLRYDIQAALQMWAANALCGLDPAGVLFIVQSTQAPYRVAVRTLHIADEASHAILTAARLDLRRAIDRFAACWHAGAWPSPWDDVVNLRAPAWRMRQIERDLEETTEYPEGAYDA